MRLRFIVLLYFIFLILTINSVFFIFIFPLPYFLIIPNPKLKTRELIHFTIIKQSPSKEGLCFFCIDYGAIGSPNPVAVSSPVVQISFTIVCK
jgi:hypothetical protein